MGARCRWMRQVGSSQHSTVQHSRLVCVFCSAASFVRSLHAFFAAAAAAAAEPFPELAACPSPSNKPEFVCPSTKTASSHNHAPQTSRSWSWQCPLPSTSTCAATSETASASCSGAQVCIKPLCLYGSGFCAWLMCAATSRRHPLLVQVRTKPTLASGCCAWLMCAATSVQLSLQEEVGLDESIACDSSVAIPDQAQLVLHG